MAADAGDDILLSYGPQGEQQAGDDILLSYTSAVPRRRLMATFHSRWGRAKPAQIEALAPYDAVQATDRQWVTPWSRGRSRDAEQEQPWGTTAPLDRAARSPWPSFGRAVQREPRMPWRGAAARDTAADMPWPGFQGKADRATAHPWSPALAKDVQSGAPWGGPMRPHAVALLALVPRAKRLDRDRYLPWSRYSRQLAPGWGIVTPPNPLPEPGESIIVPVRGVYIVQNEVLLTRVSSGASIPALRMSLAGDVDSWTWSFTASVPGQYLSLLEPVDGEAVELEAMVNGRQFRVLAERLSRDRVFGSSALSVSGRGKAALLSSPFAPTMSFTSAEDRTAQQIANEVLTPGGVPLGWTVGWSLTDWLVPGGVWSHQGSFMDALVRVAEAAGGYIRPDPLLQSLTFLHRYPTMPDTWGGATPDFELPSEVTTREGIEWQDLAAYDAVYVSGQQGGVLGYVKKMGSAGATFAQMITDPLITHADAARQRGRAILGNTGRKAIVTLSLPVLEETGVIEVGKMVEYVDGGTSRIGLVRSSSVDVTFPNVIQTIGVETHVS